MYQYIFDPITTQKVNINSKNGKNILYKYALRDGNYQIGSASKETDEEHFDLDLLENIIYCSYGNYFKRGGKFDEIVNSYRDMLKYRNYNYQEMLKVIKDDDIRLTFTEIDESDGEEEYTEEKMLTRKIKDILGEETPIELQDEDFLYEQEDEGIGFFTQRTLYHTVEDYIKDNEHLESKKDVILKLLEKRTDYITLREELKHRLNESREVVRNNASADEKRDTDSADKIFYEFMDELISKNCDRVIESQQTDQSTSVLSSLVPSEMKSVPRSKKIIIKRKKPLITNYMDLNRQRKDQIKIRLQNLGLSQKGNKEELVLRLLNTNIDLALQIEIDKLIAKINLFKDSGDKKNEFIHSKILLDKQIQMINKRFDTHRLLNKSADNLQNNEVLINKIKNSRSMLLKNEYHQVFLNNELSESQKGDCNYTQINIELNQILKTISHSHNFPTEPLDDLSNGLFCNSEQEENNILRIYNLSKDYRTNVNKADDIKSKKLIPLIKNYLKSNNRIRDDTTLILVPARSIFYDKIRDCIITINKYYDMAEDDEEKNSFEIKDLLKIIYDWSYSSSAPVDIHRQEYEEKKDILIKILEKDLNKEQLPIYILREKISDTLHKLHTISSMYQEIKSCNYGYTDNLPYIQRTAKYRLKGPNKLLSHTLSHHFEIVKSYLQKIVNEYLELDQVTLSDEYYAQLYDIKEIDELIIELTAKFDHYSEIKHQILLREVKNPELRAIQQAIINLESDKDILSNSYRKNEFKKLKQEFKKFPEWEEINEEYTKNNKLSNTLMRQINYLKFKKNWISDKVIKNRGMLTGKGKMLHQFNVLNYGTFRINNVYMPDKLIFTQLENLYDIVDETDKQEFLKLDKKMLLDYKLYSINNAKIGNNKIANQQIEKWIENPDTIVDITSIFLQRIMNDVMTIKCPKCNEVLAVKGGGCMSMRCANSKCPLYNPEEDDAAGANNRICGYCLQVFPDGDNAHEHVQNCKYNTNQGSYFMEHPNDEQKKYFENKYPQYKDKSIGLLDTNTINHLRIIEIHNRIRFDKLQEFLENIASDNSLNTTEQGELIGNLLSKTHKFSLSQNPFQTFLEGVGFHSIHFNLDANLVDSGEIGIKSFVDRFIRGQSVTTTASVKVGGSSKQDISKIETTECLICMDDITPSQKFPCICNSNICWNCTIMGQKSLWQGSDGFPRKDFQGLNISSKLQLEKGESLNKVGILCACTNNNCESINFDKSSYAFDETHIKDTFEIVKGLKACDSKNVWSNFIKLRCREFMRPIMTDVNKQHEEKIEEYRNVFREEYMRVKRENSWVKQLSVIFNIPREFYMAIIKIIQETGFYGPDKLPKKYYFENPDKLNITDVVNFWLADDWGENEKKEFWAEFCKKQNLSSKYIIDKILKLS